MTWGVWGKNYNTYEMAKLIETCLSNGITTFDHADIYGLYTTEAAFGHAWQATRLDRSQFQLISKCGIQLESEQRGVTIKHYQYNRQYLLHSVEQSLRNLQTVYLDLLLLHRPSPLMVADEIAEAINQLLSEGKILDFGVSNFTPSQTDLIQSRIKVNYNQIQFSVTHPEAMLNGSLDHMQTHGIQPMSWSPLGSVLKSKEAQAERVRTLAAELANRYEVGIEAILIAWVLKHPAGMLPVFGTANPERITSLTQALNVSLELQDWFALWTASTGVPVP